MSITKTEFGKKDGKTVYLYTLDNKCGLSAEILTYGGIIKSLIYNGTDVVLGRDTLEEYFDNDGYYGALVGRNSNRIENAEFEISDNAYKLYANDGRNNLHGGREGFNAKVWESDYSDGDEPSVALYLTSPDGDEGFPGEVKIKVTYTLTRDSAIVIRYEGVSDKDTVLNMTNHSYFNLDGHDSGAVDNHKLWLASKFFTPNSIECLPTGEVLSVKGTPFDFSTHETMGERFAASYEQIKMFGGFDHNFALEGFGYRLAGKLEGDKISMELYTDCPAVQLYTGNAIDDKRVCKGGIKYPIHGGLCLETQAFPNSLKYSHFPNGYLKAGEKYETVTAYKFINK